MDSMLKAINGMLLDMLAAMARKDQEDRRRRQKEGIALAKMQGKYRGRKPDHDKHQHIIKLRESGISIKQTVEITGCGRTTVARVWREYKMAAEKV